MHRTVPIAAQLMATIVAATVAATIAAVKYVKHGPVRVVEPTTDVIFMSVIIPLASAAATNEATVDYLFFCFFFF